MFSNQTEGFNDSLSENEKMGGVKKKQKTPLSLHFSNAAIFISKLWSLSEHSAAFQPHRSGVAQKEPSMSF